MTSQQITDIARAIIAINNDLIARGYEPMDREQHACLIDRTRHTESFGMIDDLRARVGVPDAIARPLYLALVARFPQAQYLKEFPAYGGLDFEVPEGFEDSSWHNDVSPSWTGKGFTMFADFKMLEWREMGQDFRFSLCTYDEEHGLGNDSILTTSNIIEIAAFIAATEKYNEEQRTFIGQRVGRIKAEVVHAVATGTPFYKGGPVVPDTITGFADLHAYCDANCLGGLCEDHRGNVLFPERTDCGTLHTQGFMEAMNVIQDAVGLWITTGSMRAQANKMRGTLEVTTSFKTSAT